MPISFTPGLTPDFYAGSFNSAPQHVKSIYGLLLTDVVYFNPLADDVATLVARIDAVQALLGTEVSAAGADISTLSNLPSHPQGWQDASNDGNSGYGVSDLSTLVSTISGYQSICSALIVTLQTLEDFLTEVDVDNFKLHMELLSGVDHLPPVGIIKPNLDSLMALAMSLTELENRFGVTLGGFPFYKADGTLDVSGNLGQTTSFSFYKADGTLDTITIENNEFPFYRADGTLDIIVSTNTFINHLLGLFGTLFTGDATIATAQAHMDTDPLSAGTYSSLDIIANVTKPYVSSTFGTDPIWNNSQVSPLVSAISVPVTSYAAEQPTILASFYTHITTDMAYYDATTAKLQAYLRSYGVSSHIQDPFYAFMYTDVFGTPEVNAIITQYLNGEIE